MIYVSLFSQICFLPEYIHFWGSLKTTILCQLKMTFSFCFRISICWYWTNMFWHFRDFIAMTYWWWPRSLTWGKATVMLHTDSSSYGSMENSRQVEERWFQAAAFGESGTNSLIHSDNTKDFCHHGLTRTINVIIKLIVQVPFSFKLYNITCYEWFKFQSE